MSDVKLSDLDGDIDITTTANQLTLTSGAEGVEQDWLIRLRTFLTEWFLDERIGVPYFEEILVKNPNLGAIRAIFNRITRETPGVASVTSLNLVLDPLTREAEIDIEGTLEGDLGNFQFEYKDLILPQPQAPEVTS